MAENFSKKYQEFLKEIPKNKDLKLIDPSWLCSSLRIEEIITRDEADKIEKLDTITDKQALLFLDILPNKSRLLVISTLYKLSKEKGYSQLESFIERWWKTSELWNDIVNFSTKGTHTATTGINCTFNDAISYIKDVYSWDSETMRSQWCRLFDISDDFLFKNMFIDLQIIHEGSSEKKKVHSYTELFDDIRKCKTIVLEGDAGMGKSTYLHKIAYDWAEGDEFLNKAFDLVILMRLGDLKPGETFNSFMKNLVPENDFEAINQFLMNSNNHQKTLFIMDAYDEFRNQNTCPEINTLMMQRKTQTVPLKNATVIISSRIPQSQKIKPRDWLIRTVGFHKADVLKHFKDKIENLEAALLDSSSYFGKQRDLYQNPLIVGLGAALGYIPDELYDLIDRFCKMVIHRYLKTKPLNAESEENNKNVEEDFQKVVNFLSRFAFAVMRPVEFFRLQQPISGLACSLFCDDPSSLINRDPATFDLCCKVGLLWKQKEQPYWSRNAEEREGTNLPSFPHRLFLEFFAAQYAIKNKDIAITMFEAQDMRWLSPLGYFSFSYFLTASVGWKAVLLKSCITDPFVFEVFKFQLFQLYQPQIVPKEFVDAFQKFLDEYHTKGYPVRLEIPRLESPKFNVFLNGLAKKLPLQKNTDLHISNMTFDQKSMQFLYLFPDCTKVRFLHCNDISEEILSELQKWISNKLELHFFSCIGLVNHLNLKQLFSLKELSIKDCELAENTLDSLIELMKTTNCSLERLDVSKNDIIGDSLGFISQLPKSLQILRLDDCNLSKQSVASLAEYIEQAENLVELSVKGNEMIATEPRFACSLSKSNIRCIFMVCNKWTDKFFEAMIRFNKCVETEEDDLSGCSEELINQFNRNWSQLRFSGSDSTSDSDNSYMAIVR